MSHKHVLCTMCRATFTDDEIEGKTACPACGDKGVPGDTDKQATLTLTHHEWRILFMWATNWAEGPCRATDDKAARLMGVLRREAKRQAPTLPGLSLADDIQEVADTLGTKAELHQHGETVVFEPQKKH